MGTKITFGESKVERFKELTEKMVRVYEAKNEDYGDSFSEGIQEFGYISAVVRMSDKFNRLKNLLLHNKDAKVNSESVKDTLLDQASYSIMLIMELENEEN